MTAEITTDVTLPSRYDQRVLLVQGIVREHSPLDGQAALDLAVRMVHALDTVPEKLR
ncbi:hypothetical protein CFN78_26645 [Amycolatopsis antarctica]|uniref:Uncharacterized protein n=1 Tax=Amycolatopsis antarctica TaxID=1854586 RepID=A0A263CVK5_9PSEU|nr:DUF6307 family protein [Amycolatopsis antarctica]OZM70153.1 hypothetical protein CFN78_26645 [Amycolatopsis antarctica]